MVDAIVPNSLRPLWSQFSTLGPVMLAAVILVPQFLAISIMAWPLHWTGKWLAWVSPL